MITRTIHKKKKRGNKRNATPPNVRGRIHTCLNARNSRHTRSHRTTEHAEDFPQSCNTLQHARCNTVHSQNVLASCPLQHAATRCNTLEDSASRCNTLRHAATRYDTLQHNLGRCIQRMLLFSVHLRYKVHKLTYLVCTSDTKCTSSLGTASLSLSQSSIFSLPLPPSHFAFIFPPL